MEDFPPKYGQKRCVKMVVPNLSVLPLDALDAKMYAKVARSIRLLACMGNELRAPHSKELADGIMELRITFGGNITRVLYFFVVGNTAVLTNAFVKKTQRTPPQEIVRAQMYRDDYQRRHAR